MILYYLVCVVYIITKKEHTKKKDISDERNPVTFSDVEGLDEIKEEMNFLLKYLKVLF